MLLVAVVVVVAELAFVQFAAVAVGVAFAPLVAAAVLIRPVFLLLPAVPSTAERVVVPVVAAVIVVVAGAVW